MEKAFDFKDLETRLASNGLPVVEKMAEIAATQVLNWLEASLVLKSKDNAVFAIGVPVLEALRPSLMAAIDSISKEETPA